MLKIVKDTNPQLKEKSVEVELPPLVNRVLDEQAESRLHRLPRLELERGLHVALVVGTLDEAVEKAKKLKAEA